MTVVLTWSLIPQDFAISIASKGRAPGPRDVADLVVDFGRCPVHAHGHDLNAEISHELELLPGQQGRDARRHRRVDALVLGMSEQVEDVRAHEGIPSRQQQGWIRVSELQELVDKPYPRLVVKLPGRRFFMAVALQCPQERRQDFVVSQQTKIGFVE